VISFVSSGTFTCATVTPAPWIIAENKVYLSFSLFQAPRNTLPSTANINAPDVPFPRARSRSHEPTNTSNSSASIP
jgi:hypothetical protein